VGASARSPRLATIATPDSFAYLFMFPPILRISWKLRLTNPRWDRTPDFRAGNERDPVRQPVRRPIRHRVSLGIGLVCPVRTQTNSPDPDASSCRRSLRQPADDYR
jgi:hypothetical protein